MICSKILLKGLVLAMLLALSLPVTAQTWCTKENQDLCQSYLNAFSQAGLSASPIDIVAMEVGKKFMGTPYVAKTLEIEGDEKLVVNLSGLDCTTFLENVIVFSRLIKQNRLNFDAFQEELEKVRYRNEQQGAYPSRLHYFTDWIYHNTQKGIIQDVTQTCGGKPYIKPINFMSTHTTAYRQLSDSVFVREIKKVEKEISSRNYFYIPKAEIAQREGNIKSGDLIAITTSIAGLDIVHVGFAIKQNGRTHLFHASTGSMKVEISEKPLSDYLAANKSQSGIMVCRLVEPN
ncbi:MAG: DUF1460 domain-containing protein [Bacteroidia bacterium]|nr:DUF1460 domain-containing protein [Bacteroidia bacterium]